MVTLSVYGPTGATPGPWEASPNPFSFFGQNNPATDKMNMSHFFTEMAEQILIRYQVKDIFYPAAILCYLGNYAQTTWGPPTACFIALKNGAAICW